MPKRIVYSCEVIPTGKRFLTPEEAKEYLGCSDRFLKKLRDRALVKVSRFERNMIWYDLASIDKFLEKNIV